MMKKTLLALIAAALIVSLTACAGNTDTEKDNEDNKNQITDNRGENQDGEGDENKDDANAPADDENKPDDGDAEQAQTLAETLAGIFEENAADAESAEALANTIIEKADLPVSLISAKVEEGLLSGFGNTEITGFSDGAIFAPMIGSIPFVGYVFVLPEDADIEAFTTVLSDNADLRWNICVTADEMKIDTKDNTVFFVMCPTNFDD